MTPLVFILAIVGLSVLMIVALETMSVGWLFIGAICFITLVVGKILALHLSLTTLAIAFVCYLAIGGVWSIFKWWRFLKKEYRNFHEYNDRYEYNESALKSATSAFEKDIMVDHHKGKITAWIAFWPWSLTWFLTDGIVEEIFGFLKGIYTRIGNRIIARIKAENIDIIAEQKRKEKEMRNQGSAR